MNKHYIICCKKLITVSEHGSIVDGAMVISDGKIKDIGKWHVIKKRHPNLKTVNHTNYIISPSLVDCHTHLLEFAPTTLYPITAETHFIAAASILLDAISSGITALGEQICGHPHCDFSIDDYRRSVIGLPIDVSFAATSISIGFAKLAHYTSITKSEAVNRSKLIDSLLVKDMAQENDFPGENVFLNATPANFRTEEVPRAGEAIYSAEELKQIVNIYHDLNKRIGVHVAGESEIKMALESKVDVLHHAHGITEELLDLAVEKGVEIVATPMGGTHLQPNSPENILQLIQKGIPVSIATDSYLPPSQNASWLPFEDDLIKGPDVLMLIAHPSMKLLQSIGYNENDILALLTANPAKILGKEDSFGRLQIGMDANFLVAEGIPGLEITDISKIKQVYFRGSKVINRII